MQRLMRSDDGDRGAVAVVVAIVMAALVGFAALSVDVAAMYADRQQLLIGADAAALAIAQDCALAKNCSETQVDSTASSYVAANKNDGAATADATISTDPSKVTVVASTERDHWFAGVLGTDSSTIEARSTAGWGAPSGGRAMLPMTFSVCAFNAQTGGGMPSGTTPRTIKFTKSDGTTCAGPSGNVVPGGFGWLSVNAGTCNTTSVLAETLSTSTGNSVPSGCTSQDFVALQNRTVLLPIFDQTYDSGSNAYYRVYAYAAFTITGYYFADSKFRWNSDCTGNDRCIHGYFAGFVDTNDRFDYSTTAPDMGAYVTNLELP